METEGGDWVRGALGFVPGKRSPSPVETIGDGFQGQLFAKFISEFPVTTARTSIQSNLNVAISLTDCPDRPQRTAFIQYGHRETRPQRSYAKFFLQEATEGTNTDGSSLASARRVCGNNVFLPSALGPEAAKSHLGNRSLTSDPAPNLARLPRPPRPTCARSRLVTAPLARPERDVQPRPPAASCTPARGSLRTPFRRRSAVAPPIVCSGARNSTGGLGGSGGAGKAGPRSGGQIPAHSGLRLVPASFVEAQARWWGEAHERLLWPYIQVRKMRSSLWLFVSMWKFLAQELNPRQSSDPSCFSDKSIKLDPQPAAPEEDSLQTY
ncbi:uncharacterized protein LOC106505265 [Sus scrofa]|uniref:uncharacterized protein LOC106505265 n=1 Tax=Sus scrofa TaxID=9823 RepID=UPI000A2B3816|nr:uncharacterized protein LOC106505265 [Sus scrofa]